MAKRPRNRIHGAGGKGPKVPVSALFLRQLRTQVKYRNAFINLTFEAHEIEYIADILTGDDDAPVGLLEKFVRLEEKMATIDAATDPTHD